MVKAGIHGAIYYMVNCHTELHCTSLFTSGLHGIEHNTCPLASYNIITLRHYPLHIDTGSLLCSS